MGITKDTSELGHPNSRILSMAFGRADSLEDVLKAISQGWPIARKKPKIGIRQMNMTGNKMNITKMTSEAYKAPISFPKLPRTPMPLAPTVAAKEAPIPMGASVQGNECFASLLLCFTYSS